MGKLAWANEIIQTRKTRISHEARGYETFGDSIE